MRCIARGSLASPAKSGRDLYGSLSLTLGISPHEWRNPQNPANPSRQIIQNPRRAAQKKQRMFLHGLGPLQTWT